MAGDQRPIRADIAYLTRRLKPVQAAQRTTASVDATVTPHRPLDLSRPSRTTTQSPAAAASLRLRSVSPVAPAPRAAIDEHVFPAPALGEVSLLNETNPVVRLDEKQSAIGSLLVASPRSVAWEDEHFITGALHVQHGSAGAAVTTSGNRPLVGFHGTSGIVSLRHVRQLRRALFIAGDGPLTIGVFDGAAVAVAPRNDEGHRSVLYASRIGSMLEIRVEFVPHDAPDDAIWAMLGFSMTIPLDQQVTTR